MTIANNNPPNLTLPQADTPDWGTVYNEAFDAITSSMATNTHTHSEYAPAGAYAPSDHNHPEYASTAVIAELSDRLMTIETLLDPNASNVRLSLTVFGNPQHGGFTCHASTTPPRAIALWKLKILSTSHALIYETTSNNSTFIITGSVPGIADNTLVILRVEATTLIGTATITTDYPWTYKLGVGGGGSEPVNPDPGTSS